MQGLWSHLNHTLTANQTIPGCCIVADHIYSHAIRTSTADTANMVTQFGKET